MNMSIIPVDTCGLVDAPGGCMQDFDSGVDFYYDILSDSDIEDLDNGDAVVFDMYSLRGGGHERIEKSLMRDTMECEIRCEYCNTRMKATLKEEREERKPHIDFGI